MRRVLVLVLSALLLSLMPGLAAQGATPAGGATFNVPRPYGGDAARWRIVRKVNSAINSVPRWRSAADGPRPVVLIASYFFDNKGSADALIAACKRGASVRVVIDGKVANRQARRLVSTLNNDRVVDKNGNGVQDPGEKPAGKSLCYRPPATPGGTVPRLTEELPAGELLTAEGAERSVQAEADAPFQWGPDASYVKKCKGTCRGGNKGEANMHSKFYAFSHTGSARNVVMVSSSNLNAGGALNGWNDMFTIRERPASFDFYKRIHRELTNDRDVPGSGYREFVDGPYTHRIFPKQGAGKAGDPLMQDLNKIQCRFDGKRTQVRISMFYWADSRGKYILSKVLDLARSGCAVHIIYGAPGHEIAAKLRQVARNGLLKLWDSRRGINREGTPAVRTHGKFVLVRGMYGGTERSVVMTGTQNWVWGSLTGSDENALNIYGADPYNQYLAGWERIRRHSDWID